MTASRLRPSLIVCERHALWSPILRRSSGSRADLTEVRSLDQLWQELARRPSSAVLMQVDRTNWVAAAEGVWLARDRDPQAIFLAAVLELPGAVCWFLRQMGVVHLLASPLDLPAAWRIMERHFSRLPQPALSLEEKIWDNLPWSQSYLGSADAADPSCVTS